MVSSSTVVSVSPAAEYAPNDRIGNSWLTISEAMPITVVPDDRMHGSQPWRTASADAPRTPCVGTASK